MNLQEYLGQFWPCEVLFEAKNKEYGDSVEADGLIGVAVQVRGISARLRNMVTLNPHHGQGSEEAIRDCLRDAVNYGLIGLALMAKGNFEGVEDSDNWDGGHV